MGRSLAARRIPSIVLDSDAGYGRTGRAPELAEAMHAEHLPLDRLSSDRLLLELRRHGPRPQTAPTTGEPTKGGGNP
jgi:magnesium chelatase subunit D